MFQPLHMFPSTPEAPSLVPPSICNHSSAPISEFKYPPFSKSSLTFYFNSSLTGPPLCFPNKTLIQLVSSITQFQLHLTTYNFHIKFHFTCILFAPFPRIKRPIGVRNLCLAPDISPVRNIPDISMVLCKYLIDYNNWIVIEKKANGFQPQAKFSCVKNNNNVLPWWSSG